MNDIVLRVERMTSFSQEAKLENIGLSLQAGSCLALAVPDTEQRRLLLRSLVGAVPITEGIIELNGVPIEEETPLARVTSGMGIILPRAVNESMFPDERVFSQSYMGYQKFSLSGVQRGIPWVGNKKSYRSFKKDFQIHVRGPLSPEMFILYDVHIEPDCEYGKLFLESMLAFRNKGGAVLLITTDLGPYLKYIDRAGIVHDGRMLGLVDNQGDMLQTLQMLGGSLLHA